MHFIIPILTRTRDKTSLNTALHLIVVFTLLITGVFLLLYKSVWESLPPGESAQLTTLPFSGWQGWMIMALGLMLLFFVLRNNKATLRPEVNNLLRMAELTIMAGFAVFCYTHQMTMPGVVFTLVSLLIGYSFFQDKAGNDQPEVVIDTNGIDLPGRGLRKKLEWREVNGVMLRHGVLTIDCVDNRLFQWNTVKTNEHNLAGFEEFCSTQVEQSKPLRSNNDW